MRDTYPPGPSSTGFVLTNREEICLRYLSPLMEADAGMIGEEVQRHGLKGGSNLAAIGGAVMGRLKKRGLVIYLPDLRAWRITQTGRAAIGERRSP